MKKINTYIIEKLHLNKDIKIDNDIRCLFCQLRFDRKTDEIVPDIIKVIYENDEEIKFEYLTNFLINKD